MAIAPINYGIDVAPLNPAQQIMQGMAVGQGLLDAREQGLQRQQAAEMRPLQMQAAQLGLRQGLAAEADANAQRALQARMQESAAVRAAQMQEAAQKLARGEMTPDQVARFAVEFPEHPLNKNYEQVIKARSDEQRRQDLSNVSQAIFAINAGKPEDAAAFLESKADAMAAAGVDKEAEALRRLSQGIRQNPQGAVKNLELFQAHLAPSLGKSLEELRSVDAKVREGEAKAGIEEEKLKNSVDKFAADLGLTKAQTADLYNQMKNRNLKTQAEVDKAKAEGAKVSKDAIKVTQEVDNFAANITRNIDKVIGMIDRTGTFELTGPEGKVMDQLLTEIATDQAKLMDPGSVARESEVEAMKKNLIDTGFTGLLTTNETAKNVLRSLRNSIGERKAQAYKSRGVELPAGGAAPAGGPGFATKYE